MSTYLHIYSYSTLLRCTFFVIEEGKVSFVPLRCTFFLSRRPRLALSFRPPEALRIEDRLVERSYDRDPPIPDLDILSSAQEGRLPRYLDSLEAKVALFRVSKQKQG